VSSPLTLRAGGSTSATSDGYHGPHGSLLGAVRRAAYELRSTSRALEHHSSHHRYRSPCVVPGIGSVLRPRSDASDARATALARAAAVLAIAGSFGLIAPASGSDTFPSRPMRLVLGFPAGGTPDALARAVSNQVETSLGKPVVIDNRSGANGIIAAQLVARAAPDGYTLLFSPPALIINQIIHSKAPYDVLRDFIPVANACMGEGSLLVVNPAVPAQSVAELVALSKKGKPLTYGSPGIGNTQHLLSEMFNVRAAARLIHVPYKGLPPAINGVLANEVNVLFAPPAVIVQHIKAGRLRALAFTGSSRWSFMPEVPTIAESGITGFQTVGSWMGFFIPAKAPTALVRRLNAEVRQAVQVPQVRDFLRGAGYEPDDLAPEAFRALIAADLARYAEVVRIANIKAE
jgi:tripartite-type tricarboxylate transporter receptor subunit TctC